MEMKGKSRNGKDNQGKTWEGRERKCMGTQVGYVMSLCFGMVLK
jgi:hypothetical protein